MKMVPLIPQPQNLKTPSLESSQQFLEGEKKKKRMAVNGKLGC